VGRDPVTGKRRQLYRSFDRLKDAKAEHARVVRDVAEGRYVARSGIIVNAFLDSWLPAHVRDLEEAGAAKIAHLLRPVREHLGERRLQPITRADVDALAVMQQAMDDAADEQLIAHNPVRRVKRPKQAKPLHERSDN
jgi:hypothetical protein